MSAAQVPPARAQDLYERALELERAGNEPAALSLLWEAAGLAPGDGAIQDRLGEALERIGALDAAVDAYRAAADARPAPRGASNNLVLALVKAGRSAKASRARARPRRRRPKTPTAGSRSASRRRTSTSTARSTASSARSRSIGGTRWRATTSRSSSITPIGCSRRSTSCTRRSRSSPGPKSTTRSGIVYWHQGDLDRAAKALGDAVAANPAYADAHLALGTILKARGDLKRAPPGA